MAPKTRKKKNGNSEIEENPGKINIKVYSFTVFLQLNISRSWRNKVSFIKHSHFEENSKIANATFKSIVQKIVIS